MGTLHRASSLMAEQAREDSLGRLASLLVALPLSMAVMKTRKGKPLSTEQMDDLMRDIRGKMGMLLRGNAPPKEPDPSIVRQLTGLGQRTDMFLSPALSPSERLERWRFDRGVSFPRLPVARVEGSYGPPEIENRLWEARGRPAPKWPNDPIQREASRSVAPNLSVRTTPEGQVGDIIPMLQMKSEWWDPPWEMLSGKDRMSEQDRAWVLYDLMRRGLFP